MTPEERQDALAKLRQRLWFLEARLKDVSHEPALAARVRGEKVSYYTTAIAEARGRLRDLEGH